MSKWIHTTLNDICRSDKGAIISGPFGSNISSKFFVLDGVPVIRGNNLSLSLDKFYDDDFVFVTEEKADELNCYAEEGDLIFTAAGTIGQVGILEAPLKYKKYVISNKQLRARIDTRKVDLLYAYYWFASAWMQNYFIRNNKGSTVPLITLSELKDAPIWLQKHWHKKFAIARRLKKCNRNGSCLDWKTHKQRGALLVAEAYYIFTDEAGAYNKRPSESFRRSHPFYIRANVRLSASDYRVFQREIQELNTKYGVPVGEEIKWSDLWEISKGKYRADFLKSFTPDKLKGYYRRFFNRVVDKPSLLFIFTVTCVYTQPCYQAENEVLKFHMQEAFQRIQMDTRPDGFATMIMDELNQDKVKQLKDACHRMMVEGDFVKYENVYHGVLTECSSQSTGIQLADYAVGIMNCYLRKHLMSRGDYTFATDLYTEFVLPHLRKHANGTIVGYGVREVPSDSSIRQVLIPLFN